MSRLRLCEEIRDYIDLSPYLLNDRSANNTREYYPEAEPEAGFILGTRRGAPRGEYVLHAVFILSAHALAPDDHVLEINPVKRRRVTRLRKLEQEYA